MSKVVRTILIVLGVIALGILALVAVAYFATAPLTKQADAFFETLAAGDTTTAYEDMTTDQFREYSTYEDFEVIVVELRLNEYESSFWSSRSIEDGLGVLNGTISLTDNTEYTAEVQFYKEEGRWKVQYLHVVPAQ